MRSSEPHSAIDRIARPGSRGSRDPGAYGGAMPCASSTPGPLTSLPGPLADRAKRRALAAS